jgi:hypothetical protein
MTCILTAIGIWVVLTLLALGIILLVVRAE